MADLADKIPSDCILPLDESGCRSAPGSMTDLITHFCRHFSKQMCEGGKVDLRAIAQELNNMPQRPIGWKFAQEQFAELCSRF